MIETSATSNRATESWPTLQDVEAARPRVYAVMQSSPMLRHPLLEEWLGCEAWVKHENHNPTGAFKIRGGLNLLAQLSPEDRRRGVISASTGNHGQSIAFASRMHGVRCRIVVPVGNNPDKNAAMRAYGAEVIEHGRDYDEARIRVEQMVEDEGWRYIHSANEPHLIAGVGTYALEMLEQVPDLDYVFVPIGGGSGAAGCCIVRGALGAKTKIVGVQASGADAFTRSWRGPARVTAERVNTFAEGMATRVTFDLTFAILEEMLDDIVLLDEPELEEGVRAAMRLTHNVAEGSGAAPLAAAKQYGQKLAGKKVACVMSGGNIDLKTLARIVASAV
ncbi:MAG: threonine dehydratase [Acidobacteria bacterium]|nr:MAG: threonine dehydratase [Acidobacteriota bacterium]